ncbi:MAG: PspA/IM30 family protein [Hyphomicrobium sp.]
MLKTLTTLLRGAAAEADEALFDANAIRVLEQQLRDAAAALEASKRELACAMAHEACEQRAVEALAARQGELELSACKALEAGSEALAEDAAVVIAALEDETADRRGALVRFASDVRRLKILSEDGRKRLSDLRRGLELARAQEALRRAGANGRRALAAGSGALREAEATLGRIREQNLRDADVSSALDDLERQSSGQGLADRLSAAGFSATPKTNPAVVLARLRKPLSNPPPAEAKDKT